MAKIIAPNKKYNDIIANVHFTNGVGETTDSSLIGWFKEKGYTVEEQEQISKENQINTQIPNDKSSESNQEQSQENQEQNPNEGQDQDSEKGKKNLNKMNVQELKQLAKGKGIAGYEEMKRDDLLKALKE